MKPYYEKDGITIYHGDCREILPTIEKADMIFTDPPYGHTEHGSLQQRWEAVLGWQDGVGVYRDESAYQKLIANDGAGDVATLIPWFFKECKRVLAPGGCCCCCCGGGGPDPQFARWSMWLDAELDFKQMVIWDKGPMGMGWHYRRSYETVLVAHNGSPVKWYDESKQIENIIRPGAHGISKIIPSAEQHPTEKHPSLSALFIRLHSQVGETVLDPFMGSGSTVVAARTLGRKVIGIEIEERWCEMTVKKLEQGGLGI